jgi:hypothetical protein
VTNSLKSVFLSYNNIETDKLLAQNTLNTGTLTDIESSENVLSSLDDQDKIDTTFLSSKHQQNFAQCLSA